MNTNWMKKLDAICQKHADKKVHGGGAKERTRKGRREILFKIFGRLHELGYRIHNVEKLEERHIKAFAVDAWYKRKYKPKTLNGELSTLRVFGGWIGQPNLVKDAAHYLPEVDPEEFVVSGVAKKSKSWTECGIDVLQKIKEADAEDWRFGMALRLMLAFGLRRKEALACYPHKSTENKVGWQVYPDEAKNSRPRVILIEHESQRKVIEYVKSKVKKNERMRWMTDHGGHEITLDQAMKHFNYLMRKIGVTKALTGTSGHGLRAQFVENYAVISGFVPPTLGGDGSELSKDDLKAKRAAASETLGHSRIIVTNSYYGAFNRNPPQADKDRIKKAVAEATELMKEEGTEEGIEEDYREDCKRIIGVLADYDIAITIREVQFLWKRYSARHNEIWVKPTEAPEIENGIFVAATMHRRKGGDAEDAALA
ncbi:phage integrase N-terminal domain-containing protein [Noviherbaspirillum pedocola]|uniref:Integrase domain-containing protein n=1 Tax=Noviherbaspirillum pedocola TaxID=2801341 RepID=A0A934W6D5_9BURK|nr:integrase domain-containing protein [Noviherbaspirillum pedocola]MBK4736092.1 integrase domain-containing protein [Noviherbaspirillum pedocola]